MSVGFAVGTLNCMVDATLGCTTSVTLVAVGVMWPKADGTHWRFLAPHGVMAKCQTLSTLCLLS